MGQEDSESNGVLGDLQESTKAVKKYVLSTYICVHCVLFANVYSFII
mgnify:CR=1 FL=1